MKIGLMGAQCTGKTTLVNHMKRHHPSWVIVEEVARSCPHPINERTGFMSQHWILKEQIHRELEAGCLHPTRTVISDRTTLDHVAYIMYAQMSEAEKETLVRTASAWGRTYDIIFYIPVDKRVKLQADGVRSVDESFQNHIASTMESVATTQANIIRISGTVEERAKAMEKALSLQEGI